MAQFRGTVQGNRGQVSRLGSKSSGLVSTCEGYNKGIKVIAKHDHGRDIFIVFETDGTNSSNSKLITVIEGEKL